jgi:glycine/D-amino acid oxidase-like deaminating enzyme
MDRRTFLESAGLALAGYGLSGCATTATPRTAARRAPINLAPVRASWDRVIRTTVGLRPHRDSGFVLRAEPLDSKTIIHNYGHAGAGMSLGWGCGVMVAEMAQDKRSDHCVFVFSSAIAASSIAMSFARS